MKYIAFKILFFFILLSAYPADIEKNSKDISHRILVHGLDNSRISSNIYLLDSIAEKCEVSSDSIASSINEIIVGSLCDLNREFEFVYHNDFDRTVNMFDKLLFFENEDNQLIADLSYVEKFDLENLLNEHNASYLLIISRYNLKWEGEPFNSLFYEIDYELIGNNKKKIIEAKTGFHKSELLPFDALKKKYNKQVKKIASSVEKALD